MPLAQDVVALMKYLKSTSAKEYSRLLTLEDKKCIMAMVCTSTFSVDYCIQQATVWSK